MIDDEQSGSEELSSVDQPIETPLQAYLLSKYVVEDAAVSEQVVIFLSAPFLLICVATGVL